MLDFNLELSKPSKISQLIIDESLLKDELPLLSTKTNARLKTIYKKNNNSRLKYDYFYEDYDFPSQIYACDLCGAYCYCYTGINKYTVRNEMIKVLRKYAWSEFRRFAKKHNQKINPLNIKFNGCNKTKMYNLLEYAYSIQYIKNNPFTRSIYLEIIYVINLHTGELISSSKNF